ncbi:hypothetical protein P9112_007804 [Eukaryota sp. TZLM1-RC]
MPYPRWLSYIICDSDLEIEYISAALISSLKLENSSTHRNLTHVFTDPESTYELTAIRKLLFSINSIQELHSCESTQFFVGRSKRFFNATIVDILPNKRFVVLMNDVSTLKKQVLSLRKQVDLLSKALDSINEGCIIIGDHEKVEFVSSPFQTILNKVIPQVTHISQYTTFTSLVSMLKLECSNPQDVDEKFLEEGCTPTTFKLSFRSGVIEFRVVCSFHLTYFYKILFITPLFSFPDRSEMGFLPPFDVEHGSASTAQEIKDQVLSSVFHELKTPLFGIYSSLELIEPEKLEPEVFEFFQLIRGGVDVLSMHINNVLEVSQLKANSVISKPESCRVNDVIDNVLDLVSNVIQTSPAEVVTFTSKVCHSVMEVDHYHLERILVCLLTNAVENTHEGYISLRAECVSDDGQLVAVKFMVKDTGIGIPTRYMPYIFEPFVSIPDTVNRTPGLGLGLTIAKLTCQLLKGDLEFQSEENHGSCFYFTLKFPVKEHLSFPLKGKTVLLISDQQSRIESVASQLREWDMVVDPDSTCSSLAALTERLAVSTYDICILDKQMSFLDHMETSATPEVFHKVSVCFMYDQFRRRISISSLQLKNYSILRWPMNLANWMQTLTELLFEQRSKDLQVLPPVTPTLFQDKLVICAEDNEVSQRLLQLLLGKKLGFKVIMVENGVELCEKAKLYYGETFALVTDLRMPKKGGHEAILEIREWEDQAKTKCRIPIIALSAEPAKALSDALQAGASFFLQKPVALTELTKILTIIASEQQKRRFSIDETFSSVVHH